MSGKRNPWNCVSVWCRWAGCSATGRGNPICGALPRIWRRYPNNFISQLQGVGSFIFIKFDSNLRGISIPNVPVPAGGRGRNRDPVRCRAESADVRDRPPALEPNRWRPRLRPPASALPSRAGFRTAIRRRAAPPRPHVREFRPAFPAQTFGTGSCIRWRIRRPWPAGNPTLHPSPIVYKVSSLFINWKKEEKEKLRSAERVNPQVQMDHIFLRQRRRLHLFGRNYGVCLVRASNE